MKKVIALLVLVSTFGFGQNLNDYKYALVPAKFSFFKEADQFRLNTLTKMFMEKYGFETYLDSEILPPNFANENCNKVFVDVEERNTIMVTKLVVVLKDCKNNVLFISEEGKSREKEYKVAYTQALREAFNSFNALQHKYVEKKKVESEVVAINNKSVEVPIDKEILVESQANTTTSNALFPQPIANGFQLINTEPKVIYKIFKTSTKDFYIASKGTNQGVFFLRNNEWFFEYYQNDKLVSEKVEVKF
ncbi:hypothetical protein [Flavobacterium sp.]|uniref:hypothetical protein n=1 Tax=Flavobacterium sp. TaxID=239 RepID=UPI002625B5A1|nr:hypothetical protein [Flavobacterium sp.]